MGKLLAILGICTVIIGSYSGTFYMGGNYRESRLKTAEYKADNDILMAQSRTMVNAFSQTSNALAELRNTPDPKIAPDSIRSTIIGLCDRRKAANLPCAPSKPSPSNNGLKPPAE